MWQLVGVGVLAALVGCSSSGDGGGTGSGGGGAGPGSGAGDADACPDVFQRPTGDCSQEGLSCPWVYGDTWRAYGGATECRDGTWQALECADAFVEWDACPVAGTDLGEACDPAFEGVECPCYCLRRELACGQSRTCVGGRWVAGSYDETPNYACEEPSRSSDEAGCVARGGCDATFGMAFCERDDAGVLVCDCFSENGWLGSCEEAEGALGCDLEAGCCAALLAR